MAKYALILTFNHAYVPGVNAILNGLDYYEHKDLDVHLVYGDKLSGEYAEKVKVKFDFGVRSYPSEELSSIKDLHMGPMMKHAKYEYMQKIKDNYEAIGHMDSDSMVLSNLTHYFEIAAKTELILCPRNPHTAHWFERFFQEGLTDEEIDKLCQQAPNYNHPIFYNPAIYAKTMKYVMDNKVIKGNPRGIAHVEIYAFIRALWKTGKLDKVHLLPGNLFLTSDLVGRTKLCIKEVLDKKYCIIPGQLQIKVSHNKFWKRGVAEAWLGNAKKTRTPEGYKLLEGNIAILKKFLRLFNYEWKVKLNEVYNGPTGEF